MAWCSQIQMLHDFPDGTTTKNNTRTSTKFSTASSSSEIKPSTNTQARILEHFHDESFRIIRNGIEEMKLSITSDNMRTLIVGKLFNKINFVKIYNSTREFALLRGLKRSKLIQSIFDDLTMMKTIKEAINDTGMRKNELEQAEKDFTESITKAEKLIPNLYQSDEFQDNFKIVIILFLKLISEGMKKAIDMEPELLEEEQVDNAQDEYSVKMLEWLDLVPISKIIPIEVQHEINFFVAFENNIIYATYDDEIYGCGYDSFGRLGFGDEKAVDNPKLILELKNQNLKSFHIGESFAIGVTSDNYLYAWGWNHFGQLGHGQIGCQDQFFKPDLVKIPRGLEIKNVCCGDLNAMVLTGDGKLFVFGNNKHGYFGENTGKIIHTPILFTTVNTTNIASIHLFQDSFFFTVEDKQVYSWGENCSCRLGFETSETHILEPKLIKTISSIDIIKVRCCANNSYFLSEDGKLYFTGKYLFEDNFQIQKIPALIETDKRITDLENTNNFSEEMIVVLSDEPLVYELHSNTLRATEFESMREYSIKRWRQTHNTYRMNNTDEQYELLRANNVFAGSSRGLVMKELIGSGAFGKVCKAIYRKQLYAVKKLLIDKMYKELLDKNSELEIMKSLKSEFVVILYDFWTETLVEEQFLFMRMELCDEDLKKIIMDKDKVENNVETIINFVISGEIFRQLNEALEYLHVHKPKVIHRDLKPANVLAIYRNGFARIKLSDFGLAKFQERESQTNTSSVGTQKYMAPEVKTNKYNEKVDIYSLGVMLDDLFGEFKHDQSFELITRLWNKKLSYLKELSKKMLHGDVNERPSATYILKKSLNWSFSKKQLYDYGVNTKNNQKNRVKCYLFLNSIP